MKRFLFALVMLSGVMTVKAQQYDELDLLGTWTVTSQTGEISNTLKTFEKITFGETMMDYYHKNMDEWEYQESFPVPVGVLFGSVESDDYKRPTNQVSDFFISNGNKLHILIVDKEELTMLFVIQRFTGEELVLTNYNGKCEITLTKSVPTVVSNLSSTEREENEYYSLDGIKVSNPDKGIFVEKTGNSSHLITK